MPEVFPDSRWGRENSVIGRLAVGFASTRIGARLIRTAIPLDRMVMARTKGKFTALGPIGLPTMLLTTIGRKSGQPRTSPLIYLKDGNRLVVVGTNFGQEHHPAWTANLLSNPDAQVTMGGSVINVHATTIDGPERDELYEKFVAVGQNYDAYRHRTSRQMRMFALSPADSPTR